MARMSVSPQSTAILEPVGNAQLAALKRRLRTVLTNMQIARLSEVLRKMPEHHLKSIGVEREDIPRYARKLILSEAAQRSR